MTGAEQSLSGHRQHTDRLFDRACNQTLDFFRRSVLILGLDGEGRIRNIGKKIQGRRSREMYPKRLIARMNIETVTGR